MQLLTLTIAGATAPTAAQSASQSVVTAQVYSRMGYNQIVTHNWNLTATQLAALFPFVECGGFRTERCSARFWCIDDSNNVTLSKRRR